MTDKEILLDLLHNLARVVHRTVNGLSLDGLRWQPDEEANNIAVTVWHFSRAFDIFKARLLEGKTVETELWYRHGWAAKTGYDPQGIGWGGFGNLAGYTRAEVEAVPILSCDELLAYFDQVHEAMCGCINDLPAEALHQRTAASKPAGPTPYDLLRNLLVDSYEHVGEIKAIKVMWQRRTRSEELASLSSQ